LLNNAERYLIKSEDDPFLIKNNFGVETKIEETIDTSDFFVGTKRPMFIAKRVADIIKSKYIFKTLSDTEQVLVYENDEGFYNENGIEIIKAEVRKLLGEKCTINRVNEVVAEIKDTTHIDRKLFDSDNIKLLLENGILDLNTFECLPHSPKSYFTMKIPIKYKKGASCPQFLAWLEGKVENELIRMTIQEMFGYCLLKDNRLQKAFMLYGDRRTGKSTCLAVLRRLLGQKNITAMSLQFLTEDNFAMAYIYGKLANIYADLSTRALRDTGKFMVATGEDAITIARKREHPFTFQPFTKFIFSCNTIPSTYNKDMAFYRRWTLINFNKQTPENEVDEKLIDKIASEEELEGILLWAIEGLKRLVTTGRLSYPHDENVVKDLYERNSDSISSFIFNCVIEDDTAKTIKRDVYKAYKKFCDLNKLRLENPFAFGRVFREVTGCGTGKEKDIPAYIGVKLKEKIEKIGLRDWLEMD